ncbi:MAG: hypothetical protein R3F65_14730 [bacterium]
MDRSGDATFDYVIGCTGCAAFQYADLVVVRDGALLVNAASGRHELPVDRLEADEVLFVGIATPSSTRSHPPRRCTSCSREAAG